MQTTGDDYHIVLSREESDRLGIIYTSKKILQFTVILLGFDLNLFEIDRVGATSLPIILSTISVSLIVAFLLHKMLHMPANVSALIGVGSSICGGSAIAATAPVINADDKEIAQSISVIFLFNVIFVKLTRTLIIVAMAAIGLNTDLVNMIKTGGKAIIMGLSCWLATAAVSLFM